MPSVADFERDLQQLGGMIEGFYSEPAPVDHQAGGRKKKRSVLGRALGAVKNAVRKVKKTVGKKVRKVKAKKVRKGRKMRGGSCCGMSGGAGKRHYKVVDVNGKPYPFYYRYSGAEPKDAALKAFHFICKKLSMGRDCNITFTLKETTRGSDKRNYGPYRGKFVKLAKPVAIKIKGKVIHTKTHMRVVDLVR